MTLMRKVDSGERDPVATPEFVSDLTWIFRVDGVDTAWSWELQGCPPIDHLAPVRTPRSSRRNRHVPSPVYSMTNGGYLTMESGLEHDLLRRVDRNQPTRCIVAQPFKLSWNGPEPAAHTPDLLALFADGSVTVWDAKAVDEQDDDYWMKATVTRKACELAGWRYQVFSGLGPTERLNLLWLHGFRRRPPWTNQFEEKVVSLAASPSATLGNIMQSDDGSGELIAVMWHLLWRGVLSADIEDRWTTRTPVTLKLEIAR
jgi:hypothetical protein